jgi:hypothetical protein
VCACACVCNVCVGLCACRPTRLRGRPEETAARAARAACARRHLGSAGRPPHQHLCGWGWKTPLMASDVPLMCVCVCVCVLRIEWFAFVV